MKYNFTNKNNLSLYRTFYFIILNFIMTTKMNGKGGSICTTAITSPARCVL